MSETFAPTLVFETAPEPEAPAAPVIEEEKPAPKPMDESVLNDAEREMAKNFSSQIDLSNSNAVLQYGSGVQKRMADFSESALANVKSKDLGEVGDMLAGVVTELKSFDVEEEEKGFFGGFFKKQSNKMTALKAKYDKVETNVDAITKNLTNHQVTLLKDIATLDKMYEENLNYFKELTMYIIAGKMKLEEVRNGELKELVAKAEATGLAEDAQAAKDLANKCDRFEKKLHDLELTRMISVQTAPQIRLIQDSDTVMVEKIQSTIVNTIPLWKSQMVLALGVEHSNQAAKAQQQVTDLTNELLRKNADKLKMASVETAKAAERGIVDIDTLKHTNQTLISTLDEIVKIQTDGRKKRAEAEVELRQMEDDLKNKLLEIHNK